MSNPFFFEPNFTYEPVVKPIEAAVVEQDLAKLRNRIVNEIKQQVLQKDLSRGDISLATRTSRSAAGLIVNGNIEKVSTDRLLRFARRLGLKAQIKFSVDA